MSPKGRAVAALAGVLLVVGLVLGALRLADQEREESRDTEVAPAGVQFSSARVIGRHRGTRQWEVDTRTILEEDAEWIDVEGVESGIIYRDGEIFLRIRADRARSHKTTNNLVLLGNVEVLRGDTGVFLTDRLEWDAATEMLYAPEGIELLHDGERILASTMEADMTTEVARFLGDVRIIRDKGDVVTAREVLYLMDEEILRMVGSFRATLSLPGSGQC